MLEPNEKKGIATFFTIWFGETVSVFGSGLTNFGIGVWLFQKTGTVTAFALSAIAVSLPGILLLPIAGALVDRWNRRTVLIVSNIGSGAASLALVLCYTSGKLEIWVLYCLMALNSAFNTLIWPAITASISLLVPKEHLGRANAMQQGAEAGSMMVTPVLGAILYAAHGLQYLVSIDVASFAFAIAVLLFVRLPSPAAPLSPVGEHRSFVREALYGFGYIRERKGLFGLLMFFLGLNFVGGVITVLWTPLILGVYHSPKILGTLDSIMGLSFLAGTIFMTAWGGPKRRIYGVFVSNGLAGAGMLLMAISGSWWLLAIIGFVFMFTLPIGNSSSQAIWQSKVDPAVQGRVFAIRRMIAWCTAPLANFIAGPLADKFFGPAMMPGGALAHTFGFIGTGVGAGIRLMIVLGGVIYSGMALVAYATPHIRNVEDELPDAITDPTEPTDLPVSEVPVGEPLQA